MKRICVIGIGNPLRCDDGIGIVLLNKLIEQKKSFPKKIEFIDGGTGGMNLLHVISRYDIVFIIDAMQLNAEPGYHRIFNTDEIRAIKKKDSVSTHADQLPQVIEISRQLKKLPKQLFIFGVQPKKISYKIGLSKELQSKVDILLTYLINEINKIIVMNK